MKGRRRKKERVKKVAGSDRESGLNLEWEEEKRRRRKRGEGEEEEGEEGGCSKIVARMRLFSSCVAARVVIAAAIFLSLSKRESHSHKEM